MKNILEYYESELHLQFIPKLIEPKSKSVVRDEEIHSMSAAIKRIERYAKAIEYFNAGGVPSRNTGLECAPHYHGLYLLQCNVRVLNSRGKCVISVKFF